MATTASCGISWVSIHAPYIGSDLHDLMTAIGIIVSIHAPYIGSDVSDVPIDELFEVSIHAPYIGSDDIARAVLLLV